MQYGVCTCICCNIKSCEKRRVCVSNSKSMVLKMFHVSVCALNSSFSNKRMCMYIFLVGMVCNHFATRSIFVALVGACLLMMLPVKIEPNIWAKFRGFSCWEFLNSTDHKFDPSSSMSGQQTWPKYQDQGLQAQTCIASPKGVHAERY